jgi:biotin operon repressor
MKDQTMYYSNEIANGVNHFMADTNPRAVIGDNSSAAELDDASGAPSFDDFVKDSLSSGLTMAQRDALMLAIEDPRVSRQHLRVLSAIIWFTNNASGTAFPGHKLLAKHTGYTEAGVAKALYELRAWGHMISDKRAGPNGGRALMHYALPNPTREQMVAAIEVYTATVRTPKKSADFTTGGKHTDFTPVGKLRPDVTPVGKLRNLCSEADFTHVGPKTGSDFTPVDPTVTRREELEVEVSIGDAIASPGAVAPSPADEDTTSSFAGSAWPDALDGEIIEPKAKHPKAKSAKASRKTGWDNANFDPERMRQSAEKYGATREEAAREFRNWERWCKRYPSRARYVDWNDAWDAWLDRAANEFFTIGPNARSKSGSGNGRMSVMEAAASTESIAAKYASDDDWRSR